MSWPAIILGTMLLLPTAAQAQVLRAGGEGRVLRTDASARTVHGLIVRTDGTFATLAALPLSGGAVRGVVTSFDADGTARARVRVTSDVDVANGADLALAPDGGSAALIAGRDVMRLDRAGFVVSGFGNGGNARAPEGQWIRVFVLTEGRVLLAGRTRERVALLMLRGDGRVDESFAAAGIALGPSSSAPIDAAMDAAGRVSILTAGHLVRFRSDGEPDADFARGGQLALAEHGLTGTALDVVGNALVLRGTSCTGGACRPAIARIDEAGAVVSQQPVSLSDSYAVDGTGAIVEVRPGRARRLLPDGGQDPTFGSLPAIPSRVVTGVGRVAPHPDGGYIAAHAVQIDGKIPGTLVTRLDRTGRLVTGFGRDFATVRPAARVHRGRLVVRIRCTLACTARVRIGRRREATVRVPAGRTRTVRARAPRRGSATLHAMAVSERSGSAIVLDDPLTLR